MKNSSGKYNKKNIRQNTVNRTYNNRYTNGRYSTNADVRDYIYGRYGSADGRSAVKTYAAGGYTYSRSRALQRYGSSSVPTYNMGSVAYDTAYLSRLNTREETVPEVKETKNKKTVVKYAREVAPLSLLRTLFTVCLCTAFVLAIVVFIASNNSFKDELVEAKQQLAQLKEDNAELRNSIDENIDLKEIEKEAVKLGMQKPSSYQTVKINVPKESYTVQYGTEDIDEDSVGFAEVLEDFKNTLQQHLDKILRVE